MTPTDNLEAGAGDETARADFNADVADFHDALARQWHTKYLEAAAQLAAVTAENARLREALEPFAQKMDWPLSERDAGRQVFCKMTGSGSGASFGLSVDGFRRARAVLSQEAPK